MNGCIYRTLCGECDLYSEGGQYKAFCDLENCEYRKPSNADRIRNMTDKELANTICGFQSFALVSGGALSPEECFGWLRKEANNG